MWQARQSAPREPGTELQVSALPPSGVSLEIIVRDASGKEVARARSPSPGAPAAAKEVGGTSLEVRGASPIDGTPTRRYTLSFMAVPK